MDYKRIKAIQKTSRERIKKRCPLINDDSGIYIFYRRDENGMRFAYVGQAKHLLSRLAQHLTGYQHIDLSIKKHGLYGYKNENGYEIMFYNFPESELDEREQEYILKWANKGWQLRNHTSGSQGDGKKSLDNAKQPKTYTEGVAYGQIKAMRKVREFFEKYLDFLPKNQHKVTLRKFAEFEELLESEDKKEI